MAGVLDGKERLIDYLVTKEGKRQATSGQMRVEYATVTDMHTFYEEESFAGQLYATDPKLRIFFEATDRHQDTIVPELEAGTVMRTFRSSDYRFDGVNLASGSARNGNLIEATLVTGSSIIESSDALLHSILNNFGEHRIIGTKDPFSDMTDFVITPMEVSFEVERQGTYSKAVPNGKANLENAPSIFADKRFTHLPNFDYLPPINVPRTEEEDGVPLGVYPKLRRIDDYNLELLEREMASKQSYDVIFKDTSRDNNLLMQAFEFSPAGIEKLSAVDFGEFDNEDPSVPPKRVFFIGKVLKDANGTDIFMNIFTIIAE
jgi:hypothetical protein